ncbi:MAG: membrane protein insertase YidC [Acidobacteria bacterium]|nr:membrane protein insertase YidC [Acidobacteriota bacterium]
MDQKRLLIAFVLSAVILFGWTYLFPPATNEQQNANTSQQAATGSQTPTPSQQPAPAGAQPVIATPAAPDAVPQRTVTVSTPLYEIKFDSRGATAKSWVIKKNKEKDGGGKPLRSASSTKDNPQPLELISQEGLNRGLAPLRIVTGHQDLDAALASRNFVVGGVEGGSPEAQLNLNPGEQKSVEFSLSEPGSNLEVIKRLTFDADHYAVRLETKVLQGGQPVPGAKIAIGPSLGDQGVQHYNFYSIAPEGIAAVGDASTQHLTAHVDDKTAEVKDNGDKIQVQKFEPPTHWAGVGDTYFAMALVLPQPASGLEYQTIKPKQQVNGQDRFLITAHIPVPTDGTPTYLFAGPKDHDQLQETSEFINKNISGQQVDLGQLINYGWTQRVTKPLAAPILWSINRLNKLTGSYGIAIILFTIIIYTLFFPLKWRSSKSMKKAQKLAPRMKELQEKIKGMKQNDPRLKDLQMEQLRLMKEGNPLGGCLPLLIQMPFLIALYVAITISIDFRQSSFLWIPDLSAAEPYTIHILPLLMAGSMLVLQLITPSPSADPLQRKMMAVIMPMMMLYILWSAPAGLLVYWLVGNLVGFGQQVIINRMLKSKDDEEQPPQEKDRAGSRQKKRISDASPSQI